MVVVLGSKRSGVGAIVESRLLVLLGGDRLRLIGEPQILNSGIVIFEGFRIFPSRWSMFWSRCFVFAVFFWLVCACGSAFCA